MNNFIYTIMGIVVISPIVFYAGYHHGGTSQQNEYYREYNKVQIENAALRKQQALFNMQLESALNNQKVVRDVQYKIIKQQIKPILNSADDISIESAIDILNEGIKNGQIK